MAVTVSGKNYTQISSCDTASSGGTWGGSPVPDADNKKEGAASICDCLKSSGNNDWSFTPSSSVDLSGTKHVRIWIISTHGGLLNAYVNGGIQFYASDGSNTGYWYIGGKDTYPGGWYNFVVDVSRAVDAGTKPTNMNAITLMGIRINLTGSGKNVDNTWVDNLCVCDGLIAYGDDGGSYFDFEDIYAVENDPTNGGWGILTKFGGTYYITGSLEIGDASGSNSTKFQAKSQVVIFENRPDKAGTGSNINVNLMNITVVDNGTGTTEFILGEKSGTQGISGCVIRVQNTDQLAKFDLIATDADISDFKLYGSTFLDADSIQFPPSGSNIEALNCNFESCGEVIPDTCIVKNCNFISANDRGIRIASASHNVTDCNFISCGHCVHCNFSDTVTFNNLIFSGSDGSSKYDIEHSVSGTLTVNCTNGSNPNSSYVEETGGGSTIINNAVTLKVTVVDANNDPVENAQTSIYKLSDSTQLMNEDTTAQGIAEETYNYSADTDIYVRVRKSSTGATKYVPTSTTGTITSAGFSVKITLYGDSNA